MATFDATTFCIPQDIIDTINNSEIVAQLPKSDSTHIGISSVNTGTDTFTSGVSHGVIISNTVQFASTVTLPAPLVAATDYWVVAFTPTTFQISLIKGGQVLDITSAGAGQISVWNTTLLSYIQNKITISKNRILKTDLIKECRKRFPATIDNFMKTMREQLDVLRKGFDRDVMQSGADRILPPQTGSAIGAGFFNNFTYSGYGFGLQTIQQVPEPRIFFNGGVPTNGISGTLAGQALNGAICIDTLTTDNRFPYRNRGTTASPVWTVVTVEDGIDFILNPSFLKESACYAALTLIARDGVFSNRVNYQEPVNAQFAHGAAKLFDDLYDQQKYGMLSDNGMKRVSEGDFALVQFDISGDGIYSDSERAASTRMGRVSVW